MEIFANTDLKGLFFPVHHIKLALSQVKRYIRANNVLLWQSETKRQVRNKVSVLKQAEWQVSQGQVIEIGGCTPWRSNLRTRNMLGVCTDSLEYSIDTSNPKSRVHHDLKLLHETNGETHRNPNQKKIHIYIGLNVDRYKTFNCF